jgi:chromosome segregation protein
MKIKKVEIVGFKSFVERVTLDFQQGITSVVGPNGCGKSNIVDAIRWAMGEQNAKNLRGRAMEDIIFSGSESRKPLGMAEVTMVFGNEDGLAPPAFREYSEIMITRRLYRNGDSEYLINKTPCRLLDITELFMDTGVGARTYSIIEQGKIGMILSAKPEDRRFLIEEAAGVTKFKSRKKSALRKIEATRQNLLRLGDIVSEVRRQLGSLKRQAQKAERFRTLREELRQLETCLALTRFRELQAEGAALGRQEEERQLTVETLAARVAESELRIEELRLQQVQQEKEVTRGQERVFHLTAEIQKVEGRIEFGGREMENLLRQRERLGAEREEISRRLAELDQEEEGLRAGQSALGSELDGEIRRLVEGEALLEEFSGREQDLAVHLEHSRSSLFSLLTELSQVSSRQEEAERRQRTLEEQTGRNRTEAVRLREQMEEAQSLLTGLEATLQEIRQRQADFKEERDELQETIRTLRRKAEETEALLFDHREELNRRRSRLESLQQLEKNLEGYGGGLKTLLADPAFRERFGTRLAADALDVPPKYEAAVEAVLGDRLQSLRAEDSQEVLDALGFLGEKEGRCTFLLPQFRRADFPSLPGTKPLAALVGAAGDSEVLESLLAGVCLVDSVAPFLAGGLPAGVVLVTEGGEVLTSRGEMTGGGRSALDRGLLHKKREMRDLAQKVEELSAAVRRLEESRQQGRMDLTAAEEGMREVEAALHRKELKLVDSEKDLLRVREQAERLQDRLEVLSLEEDQLHEEEEDLSRQLTDAARERQEKERLKTDQEETVTRLQEELKVLRREGEIVRETVTSLKVSVASIREREEGSRRSLERLASMRKELHGRTALLSAREAEGEEEQSRLRSETERLRTELEVLFSRREEETNRFNRIRESFESRTGKIEEQEEGLKELRGAMNQAREDLSALQLQGRERQLEAEHLRQSILDRHRVDLAELDGQSEEAEEPFDAEQGQKRIGELRRLIDDIGEVNLTAIEEYRELEERWQFLTTQQEDLKQSLDGLQAAITKINRTTRKRFRETFELVNAKFQEVFPRLFRGGKAELRLTDEEDLLETGIDIVVQPPGKKLQGVSLLSGGEKALTAVALIFSIFLIKPSPFCMLDEVDAPLDDANIGRFNDLVREMAEISQFIIITHNKRTMEIADSLYGVTMEEPGVSRLVSVRINEF